MVKPVMDQCTNCLIPFPKRRNNGGKFCSTLCRFLSKVDRKTAKECWEWLGSKNSQGRGNFQIYDQSINGAHRAAYFLFRSEHPKDRAVEQTCGNIGCVNPEHLRLGAELDQYRKQGVWK